MGEPREKDYRRDYRLRLRLLWIGFAAYLFISVNALRYADRVPLIAFFVGESINIAILLAIVFAIRSAREKVSTAGMTSAGGSETHER